MNSFLLHISHFFVANRALTLLLITAVSVFGVWAFVAMPKQYNPEILRPAFVVSLTYAGATPAVAMERVGYSLVEKIQTIPQVEDIVTTVTDGAHITMTIMFAVGENPTSAKADVMTELASFEQEIGGALGDVQLQEINPETIPMLQVVLSSDARTVQEVRAAAVAMRTSLLSVEGVSAVEVVGAGTPALMIDVDPLALARAGVSIVDLQTVLASIGWRQVTAGFSGERFVIPATLSTEPLTASAVGAVPLTPTTAVRDVAAVYEGVSPERSYTMYATKDTAPVEVVMVGVSKRAGASAPAVAKEVHTALQSLAEEHQVSFAVVADDGQIATTEISGLSLNLITSIVIVAAVLFLFLSPRAALVVLITVPLTFMLVLGIGYIAGETINRITLFALILSLGLLVDASIVVVDIIYEHLARAAANGRVTTLARIAAEAVEEVGAGLVLSAVTSVVVFLPMLYITGMMGPYMGPIAFFVPVALLGSLVVAILLAPYIAVSILRANEASNPLTQYGTTAMRALTVLYTTVLQKIVTESVVRRRLLWSAAGLLAMALVLPATGLVHFQMLPRADRDQLYVYLDLPHGSARTLSAAATAAVTNELLHHPEVLSVQAFVAGSPLLDFNGLFKGAALRHAPEQATLRVNLTPAALRAQSSTDIVSELRSELQTVYEDQSVTIRLQEEPPGPPVQATLVAKIVSGEADTERAVADLRDLIAAQRGVVDVFTSTRPMTQELQYEVDRVAVVENDISLPEITTWFSVLTSPMFVAESHASRAQERVPVYLSVADTFRNNPSGLVSVPLQASGTVRLSDVLIPSYRVANPPTHYEEVVPMTYITAEVEGRSIVYVMISLIQTLLHGGLSEYEVTAWSLFGMTLIHDTGASLEIAWGGEWEMTLENFRDLGVAMLVALFLVYGVLVAQYRSFATPALILVTVPLALVGILFGFLILDQGFSIYLTATALIGFIALIGIVVNNAIIFLEYVEQSLAAGATYAESLIAAGTVRLRPIVLTSLTTVLGSLTIAGDPVWSGLAWSIIFGLSLSTLLTLLVLPALLMSMRSDDEK